MWKLPKWKQGRQGTGYNTLTLVNSSRFDFHIVTYPVGSYIPPHVDELESGRKHYRLNVLLCGDDTFECQKVVFKWWRFTLFRPDVNIHSVPLVKKKRILLSFGFAVR